MSATLSAILREVNFRDVRNLPLPRSQFGWAITAAAAIIVLGLVTSQAFAAAMSVTAQPLQNAGDSDLTYSSDWTGASAVVTRHESSVLTLNGGTDQITSVNVLGNKVSGAVDVKVDLKDASDTIVDTATVALPTGSTSFNQTVSLAGTVVYNSIATVSATYTATGPLSITLNLTDGWDNQSSGNLTTLGTFNLIQSSNNSWLVVNSANWTSLQFDQTVPTGATIVSTKVYVEHWEDNGSKAGDLTWEIGTGTLSSPTVLGTTNPTVLTGSTNEAIVEWDVSSWIDTLSEANDLKLKVVNNNTKGKKVNLDHVYVVVEYNP